MRKSFKQVLALVLCLCMCISLLPAPVLAEGNEDPSAAETELEPEEASVQSGDGGNEGDPDGPTYYTITFNATMSYFEDDGPTDDDARKIRSIQLEYGQSAGEIYFGELAEVDGYRFDGWCTDPECTNLLPDLDSWYPAGDATYYAKWTDLDTVDHYTVTLDAAGGHFPDGNPTVVFDVQKDSCLGDYLGKEDYIPEHDVPSFIWSGLWSEGADGPTIEDADSYTVTGDVTLFAVWADAVQLIFDPNGGCFEDQTTAPKTYKAVRDQLFTSVPDVYREDSDYVFLGWSFTADGSGDIVDVYNDFHPFEDMTLYALWEYTGSQQETYQITLYANGGFFPGASDEEHASQKVLDLPAGDELIGTFGISHEASNMVFSGWYYDEDCTEYAFSEDESIQPTQSLELYAKWVYGYLVTFNAGSGYFSEEGITTYECAVLPGHSISDNPGISNLDESLDFWGWYLTPECDGEEIYPYEYIPESDVTLYARWVQTYTVTFNANGGYFANNENHDTVVVERISIYNSINDSWGAVHSDAHMAFTGWYFDENCTEPACVVGEEYYPDHNVTLYAGWTAGYVVTFNANGGYIYEENQSTIIKTVAPGYTVDFNPTPSHSDENLDFWAWYLTPECDGEEIYPYEYIPESDVTLYARWVQTYTVTFNANGGYFANYENHDTVVVERISIYNSINGSWGAVHSDAHMAFTGWYFDENCTEPACVVGEEYYPDHDVTLYAGWIAGYIVTFNAGSGYFDEEGNNTYVCVVVPGHTIPDDPGISNLDESLAFFGWYLTPECDGEQIYPREYIPEDDVTLFAKWDRLHVDLENYQDRYTSLSYRQNGWYVWDNEMSLDIPVSAEEFAVVFCQNTNVHLEAVPAQDDPILSLIMQDAASLFKVDGFDFLFAGSLQLEFPADLIYSPGFWIDNPAADITITRLDNGASNVHVGSGTLHYYGNIEELTLYSNGGSEDSSVTVYGNIHTVNWTSPDYEEEAYYGALYVKGNIESGYSRGDQVFDLTEEKIGVVSFDLATKSFSLEAAEELVCVLNDGALLIPYEDATITKDDLHYHYDGSLREDGGISWYVAVYESRYGSYASCELPEDFTADDIVRRNTTDVTITGGYQNDAVLELTGDFGFVQLTAVNARLCDGNVGELHVEGPYVRRNQTGYPYTTVTVDSRVSIVSMAGPMDHTTVTVGPNGFVESGNWRTYELGSMYNSSTRTFGSVGAGMTIMDRGALEIMSYDEGSDLGAIMPSSTVLSGAAGISGDNQAAFMYISGTGTDLSESEIAAVNSAVGSQEYGTTAAFDIDVYSVTFDDDGSVSDYSPVTELNSEVPIVLQTPIDEEADYCLVRLHEDENSILSGEAIGSASGDDGSITVNSDRFSKYVLVNRNGSSGTDDTYSVILDANGGYFDGDPACEEKQLDFAAGMNVANIPFGAEHSDAHMVFSGWYFDPSCTEPAATEEVEFYPSEDGVHLYAGWIRGYLVTFDANGGYIFEEDQNTITQTVLPGHTVDYNPGPSHPDESLAFWGWYLTPECDGEAVWPYEYVPEGDVTLYAGWVQTYTVTFNANGGYFGDSENNETLSTVHFRAGDSVGGSWGVVHSDGHMAFTGWYFDENCTELACNSETPYYPDRDVTLYAGWTAGYLVTFDAGSGYFGEEGNTMATHTVAAGQTISYEPGMSNQDESLEFWAWYLTPECDGEEINPYEYIPEGDVTLYARWVRTYTVTFNANGGYFENSENNETLNPVRFRDGDFVGGSWGVVHSDAHMAFTGWYFDETCTELACDANTEYYPDHDVTLYAGWEEGYIVTFDATGGKFDENDSSSISVTVRKNQTLDTNYQPYHENETLLFGGWYDQPNGEGNRIHPWNYVVKSDVTFYAKWNQTYQITFHANEEGAYFWKNGEKAPSNSIRFTAGSIIDGNVGAMNDNPARLLEGWYFDAECTRPAASRIMPYTVSEDIILYAKWEDSVIVTYEANDGDDATFPNGEKTLVKYSTPGDIVGWTVKPSNTNENKIFDGWNREQDGSGETVDTYSFIPEQNVTLYASWAKAWNVTFDGNGGFINSNNSASSYSVKVRDGNTVSSVLQNPVSAANVDQTQILDYWSYDRGGTSRADNPFGTPITGNITLYAQFAEGVAVHWISGGNSLYTQYVKKGSYLTSAPGHTWYWDSACTQSADVFNVQINEETTFYLTGNNQEDKITVTFDLDGGMFRSSPLSEPETELTVIVSKGQPVIDEMESIPYFIDAGLVRGYHKDGFSFAGWTSARGGTDDFDFTQSFDQDITVYAKWKPGFLLTLDGNDHLIYDGIFARSRTIELNIPADGTIMEALSRWDETIMSGNSARNESGKILEGWYYDKACTVPVEADDPAATVTVYAKWVVPYHITVDGNGGFIYSPEGMYVVPGRPIKMVYYIEPGDDQYILIGWSLDRAGTQMIDDIDAFIPTGDTTIYAQWIKGSVVRFVSEIPFSSGYCYSEKIVPAGESVGSMNLDEGCDLMIEGWYLDSNLTRSIGALEDYVPTGSVTLYAKWGERIPVGEIQGLTLTAKSGTEISVSWTVFEGAFRYELWAGTDEEELTLINTVSGTSAQHSGLTAGTEYFYQIIAKNENGIVLAVSPIRSAAAIAVPVIRSIESTADGVKLTWNASTGAAKYRVFRKTATTGWTKVADTANTSYVDATAVNGMTYTYTVRCISADGGTYTSNFDSTGKTITYSIGYATPVIGSIENTPDGVKLTWSVSTGAAKYRVFRKTATTGWTKVADTANTSYVDTKAVNGTTYTYTVRCISADGSTYTSDFDSTGKTITYSISYATPVISSVENTSAGVKITWKASTGAAKYRVFRKTSTTGWTKVADTTSTGYVDGTVVSGTTYTYTVRCISADGNTYTSGFDSTGKSITYSAGFATPVIQSIVSTPDGVKLTWSTSSGAAKYRVFRKTATTGWAKVADTANTSYVDGTAVNGTTYTYTVRCISADGSTFTSDFDSVGKTITFTTIDTPIISSIASTGDGVKLVWNAPTGAVKYRVFRKTATTGWTKLADTASTSFIDAKAVNGETYTYTVRCINAAGTAFTSGFDSTGKTITFSIVATPEIAIIRNTGDGVQLIWNKCAGAEKYRVFRKTANGGWTKVADTVNTSFIDSKAVSGETYTYTVRCTNSTGTVYTSGFDSTGKTITCQIVATPQVTAAENRSNGIWITWSAPEGAEKYFVFRKTNGGSWQKVAETVYTSYTDVNVTSGSTYTYTVRCVSADGSVYTSKFDATGMTITRS